MKKTIDKLFVILPFEKKFYGGFDMDVIYEGHPLQDAVVNYNGMSESSFRRKYDLDERPLIAILPGSRKQEISRMLPVMIETAMSNPEYQYLVAGAPSIDKVFYDDFMKNGENMHLLLDETYNILKYSEAGMICSGTATLEAGIFNLPQVVCYKTNKITFLIARMFVKIRRFSLVNLILNKDSVTELIQFELTTKSLKQEFQSVIVGGNKRDQILADYTRLNTMLGSYGVSERIAKQMISILSNEK
jgi:lipid-A-disaccharide synthase